MRARARDATDTQRDTPANTHAHARASCPDTALALALKPCCLPAAQADDARGRTFTIGEHTFAAREVTARGKWVSRNVKASTWRGPPRHHLKERFGRWSEHLLAGMVADDKSMDIVEVQAHGYQVRAHAHARAHTHARARTLGRMRAFGETRRTR